MADTNPNSQPPMVASEEEQRLKYLEFVQVAVVHVVLCLSRAYDYAKDNSGPLKNGVQSVEGTVKTVVAPVYDRFHGVPVELLKFFDRKVDESVNKLDSHVPPFVKQVSTRALSAAQKAPSAARAVASDVKNVNVVESASGLAKTAYTKYEPAAKQIYSKYEPVAEQYAVSAWRSLNQFPLFPRVAQVVVPTAAFCSEKYNETVQRTAEKGYRVSSYLPLVPTGKIAKVFGAGEAQPEMVIPGEGAVAAH
ncbi:hypothetical protein RJ640_024740 [Escallonia rubra]|uniref:Stress-related protein n=1 Tax=Escallonia rubra TaxID=112253 RepID=A0AA88UCG8_9ASTE|nr:hypothetical protein RJ640_024740 [Escallonia rubra]